LLLLAFTVEARCSYRSCLKIGFSRCAYFFQSYIAKVISFKLRHHILLDVVRYVSAVTGTIFIVIISVFHACLYVGCVDGVSHYV